MIIHCPVCQGVIAKIDQLNGEFLAEIECSHCHKKSSVKTKIDLTITPKNGNI